MLFAVILFMVGLVLIVKGGDAFVDAASWIAEVSGIPPFIVGATIVSLATTMPEMLVSVIAAAGGKVDMAVGNAVGSVTANTAMILAIAMIAMPGIALRADYLVKSLLLIGCVATLLAGTQGGSLSWWASGVLVVLFVMFIAENIRSAKRGIAASAEEKPTADKGSVARNLLLFALGAAGIVVGARLLVDSGSAIASSLGVPESIIAVTIVAVGTSLPELVTTITAILKKQASLSAGNVIGANIIDTALILPICSLVSGKQLPMGPQSLTLDIPVCLLAILLALAPMLIKQKFMRWQGFAGLAVYAAYLVAVIL